MKAFLVNLKQLWSRLSWLDLLSIAIVAAGLLLASLELSGTIFSFLKFLAVLGHDQSLIGAHFSL